MHSLQGRLVRLGGVETLNQSMRGLLIPYRPPAVSSEISAILNRPPSLIAIVPRRQIVISPRTQP